MTSKCGSRSGSEAPKGSFYFLKREAFPLPVAFGDLKMRFSIGVFLPISDGQKWGGFLNVALANRGLVKIKQEGFLCKAVGADGNPPARDCEAVINVGADGNPPTRDCEAVVNVGANCVRPQGIAKQSLM